MTSEADDIEALLALATPETLALMTPEERVRLDELLGAVVPDITDPDHAYQAALILDDHRFIAALCNRRSGKTYGACLKQCRDAMRHPLSVHMFLGITLDSAKRNCWEACFKDIDFRFGLGMKFNEANSTIRFPNGATVYVIGADASADQKKKMRGGKYRSIVVDEAQDFSSDLDDLVKSVLRPAVMDQLGWIMLQGTPGQMPIGLFYRITKDAEAQFPRQWDTVDVSTETEWHGHTWSSANNPRVAAQLKQELASMLAINPAVAETPSFQREWLGRWVTDSERRVYRVDQAKHSFALKDLPKYAHGEWHHVIGVDLGFNDDTALTVIAWHDHDKCAYIVASEGEAGLDITDTADWIRQWMDKYGAEMVVVDGANKQAVEEIRRRHGLPLIAADKREKADFISILNDEVIKGCLKIAVECSAWWEEAVKLSWEERAFKRGVRKEDPRAPNHKLDSALYAYRLVYAYLSEEFTPAPKYGTEAYYEKEEKESLARLINRDDEEDDLTWLA